MQLRVLTLNVWFEQVAFRWKDQVSAILGLKPDVICLQEVQSMDVAKRFREAFGSEYECAQFKGRLNFGAVATLGIAWGVFYLPWALAPLLGVMPRHKLGASLSALFLSVLLWRNPAQFAGFLIGNRSGLLLFAKKEKVKSIRTSTKLFQEWLYDPLDWVRPRGFLTIDACLQADAGTAMPFKVITTHLDQVVDQPAGRGRVRQAKELLDEVSDFEGFALIAADLNCTKVGVPGGTSCGTYEMMRKEMADAWDVNKEPCVTWDQVNNPLAVSQLNDLAYGEGNTIQTQADYVLWKHKGSGKVSCSACDVIFKDPPLSDHYGILRFQTLLSCGPCEPHFCAWYDGSSHDSDRFQQ